MDRRPSTSRDAARSRSPEAPVSHVDDLQVVQMELGILRDQIWVLDQPELQVVEYEEPVDQEEYADPFDQDLHPQEILRILCGRGRHTEYLVRWSDGEQTVNSAAQITDFAPDLLLKWRRANATANNRRSRERRRQN